MYIPGQHTLISGDPGSGRTNATLVHMRKFEESGHRLVSIGRMLDAFPWEFPQLDRLGVDGLTGAIESASQQNPTLIIIEHDTTAIDMSTLRRMLAEPQASHLTLLVKTTAPAELSDFIDLFPVRISLHHQEHLADLVLGGHGRSIITTICQPGLGLVREDAVIRAMQFPADSWPPLLEETGVVRAMQFPLFRDNSLEDPGVSGIPHH